MWFALWFNNFTHRRFFGKGIFWPSHSSSGYYAGKRECLFKLAAVLPGNHNRTF
jgi:hypothetical protein